KITAIAGAGGTRLRDRSRSVKLRVLEIARVSRTKGPINQEKLKQRYRRLLETMSRVVGQAKHFSNEVAEGVKRSADILQQLALDGLRQQLDTVLPLVRQVMRQTRARIFHGKTRTQGKILSLFEPATEVIRKGKAGKPNEFGNMVKLQEAENQIVIDYEVYDRRPSDAELLIPAIEAHQAKLGRPPRLVAADAAFYSAKNDAAAKTMVVKRVCIPNRSSKSRERKREQKKRWFRNGQKWRTGMRGVHQRGQAATRSRSLPLQRLRRNEPLGWPRHHRRQRRQHRPRDRKAIKAVGRPSPSKLSIRPPVNPAGNALRFSIDRRSQSAILQREVCGDATRHSPRRHRLRAGADAGAGGRRWRESARGRPEGPTSAVRARARGRARPWCGRGPRPRR